MNRYKRTLFSLLALLLVPALLPGLATAAGNPVLDIRNGYVRGLPPGSKNTSAYMTIVNTSDVDMALTGATSPVAESVTLHATTNTGGMMSMEHLASAELPAHGKLVLESGGKHLMLMGLKRPLREGTNVRLTLQFEGGYLISVELPVVSVLDESP